MSVVTITALKAKFETGDFPTQQDFIDFIDTLSNSGTYTPTLTNVANLDSSTAAVVGYSRTGDTVTAGVYVTIDSTAGGTNTQLGISLPIASDLSVISDLTGCANAITSLSESAGIYADITNNRAEMRWLSVATTSKVMIGFFTYRVK